MNYLKKYNHGYQKNNIIKKVVFMGLMLSITFMLHYLTNYLSWPILSWLKIDFSAIPIIIILFLAGLKSSLLLSIIRFIFAILISSDIQSIWLGPLIQLIIVMFLILSIYFTYKLLNTNIKNENIKILVTIVLSIILVSVFASLMNWLWATALYLNLVYDAKVGIDPISFNKSLKLNQNISDWFNGKTNWHLIAWQIYLPFNIVKFSAILITTIPIIKISKKSILRN